MELVIIPVFIVLFVLLWIWHFNRSRYMVESWADAEGMQLLECERRLFWAGPFWWRTGKGQCVFRVTVRDSDGSTRSGYVRVGGWFLGLLSDQVDVVWDDER